eukprot:gene22488-29119_t
MIQLTNWAGISLDGYSIVRPSSEGSAKYLEATIPGQQGEKQIHLPQGETKEQPPKTLDIKVRRDCLTFIDLDDVPSDGPADTGNGSTIIPETNGSTVLYWAAWNGHIATVYLLLKRGADIRAKNNLLVTMLPILSGRRDSKKAADLTRNEDTKYLLQTWKQPSQGVQLIASARDGKIANVKSILNKGAIDVNYQDWSGATALHLASSNGWDDVCVYLLDKGCDITLQDHEESTSLHFAAKAGHTKTCSLLISRGAEVQDTDQNGSTALLLAAKHGHNETCALLLTNGADIHTTDKNGSTALLLAAKESHMETCSLLFSKGANINTRDNDGKSVLDYADEQADIDKYRYFLSKGASQSTADKAILVPLVVHDGFTPLHRAARIGHTEFCSLLLKSGADLTAKTKDMKIALHYASEGGHFETCFYLLVKGADLEAKSKDGKVPADYASGETKRLLKTWKRALMVVYNSTAGLGGKTALHLAAFNGYTATVSLLLKKGADPNAKDSDGMTPLHKAAWEGHTKIVELLLKKGADRSVTDNAGKRPIDLSEKWETQRLLRNWGSQSMWSTYYPFFSNPNATIPTQLPPPVFTKATTSSPNMQPTASTLSTWSGSAFAGLACVSNAYALAIGCIVLLIFYCLMRQTRRDPLRHPKKIEGPVGSIVSVASKSKNPPNFLICPISHVIFVDPVTTAFGHTYSRVHIEAWFQTHDTDPRSNGRVPSKALIPNYAIRAALEEYYTQ